MSDENELAEGMQVYQGALDDPGDDVVARRDLAKALRDLVHATGGGHVAPARLRERGP